MVNIRGAMFAANNECQLIRMGYNEKRDHESAIFTVKLAVLEEIRTDNPSEPVMDGRKPITVR